MVDLIEIAQKCPAKAWAQHRFSTYLDLVNGNQIVVRFDLPRDAVDAIIFTPGMISEKFGTMMGSSAKDMEVCAAIADVLNARILMTHRTVALQLKLVAEVLLALQGERHLLAFLMLRSLAAQLDANAADLWLYEWPEWLSLVDQYVKEQCDADTLKIIEKLSNHG